MRKKMVDLRLWGSFVHWMKSKMAKEGKEAKADLHSKKILQGTSDAAAAAAAAVAPWRKRQQPF